MLTVAFNFYQVEHSPMDLKTERRIVANWAAHIDLATSHNFQIETYNYLVEASAAFRVYGH